MIKKEFYLFVVVCCSVWTGCSQATDTNIPGEAVPVRFSATPVSSNSRAAIDGIGFANGTQVTIYGINHSTEEYAQSQWIESPFMNNVQATISNSGSITYTPVLFFPTTESYSFFSLFKGSSEENGVFVVAPSDGTPPMITISLQPTSLAQPDVMLAAAKNETKTTARSGMAFNYKHLLTQIRFNIAKTATYTKAVTLTKVSANSYQEATTTIDNEALEINTSGSKTNMELVDCATSPLTLTATQQTIVQTGKTEAAYALLFPGNAADVVFTFTMNGVDYPLTLEGTWEKGKVYTYDITFDKGLTLIVKEWDEKEWGVVLGGSSVLDTSDWDNGGTLDKEVI